MPCGWQMTATSASWPESGPETGHASIAWPNGVRAGQVYVNAYGAGGGVELPFGGFKKSGHGREKGFEALYDMSATKTVVFHHE